MRARVGFALLPDHSGFAEKGTEPLRKPDQEHSAQRKQRHTKYLLCHHKTTDRIRNACAYRKRRRRTNCIGTLCKNQATLLQHARALPSIKRPTLQRGCTGGSKHERATQNKCGANDKQRAHTSCSQSNDNSLRGNRCILGGTHLSSQKVKTRGNDSVVFGLNVRLAKQVPKIEFSAQDALSDGFEISVPKSLPNTFSVPRGPLRGLLVDRTAFLQRSARYKSAKKQFGPLKDPTMAPGVRKMCRVEILVRRFRIRHQKTPRTPEFRVTGLGRFNGPIPARPESGGLPQSNGKFELSTKFGGSTSKFRPLGHFCAPISEVDARLCFSRTIGGGMSMLSAMWMPMTTSMGVFEGHFRNLRNKMTPYVKTWLFLSCIVVRRSPPKNVLFF